jgi:nitrite reductase (NAD(P)H)
LSIAPFEAEEREDGWMYVRLPGVEELDAVLGTERWRIRGGDDVREMQMKWRKGVAVNLLGKDGFMRERILVGKGSEGVDW